MTSGVYSPVLQHDRQTDIVNNLNYVEMCLKRHLSKARNTHDYISFIKKITINRFDRGRGILRTVL